MVRWRIFQPVCAPVFFSGFWKQESKLFSLLRLRPSNKRGNALFEDAFLIILFNQENKVLKSVYDCFYDWLIIAPIRLQKLSFLKMFSISRAAMLIILL